MRSTNETTPSSGLERRRLRITGRVQGVGFRPFVYRLARHYELEGTVCNGSSGVTVDVQGPRGQLEAFQQSLTSQPPPQARIESLAVEPLPANGCRGFTIVKSIDEPATSRTVTPDLAMCEDCRREVRDPANRRYRYPFTNCTNCGPRYTIVTGLPYDRERTTMREFAMCTACRAEYEDPGNRRFHAQPNACPKCGPRVTLTDNRGGWLAEHDDALKQAVTALRDGKILALKGLGGFQLLVNATSEQAVRRLRERKARPEKPLAVMYPSVDSIRQHCRVSVAEQTWLESPVAPIVLLSMHQAPSSISQLPVDSVSYGVGMLGVMLPYTPLHMLLLDELDFPVVATSGNRRGDPICIDNDEALQLLGDIADVFLMHDRPIVRPVDDSVIRMVDEQPMVIRLARGLAPFVLPIPTGASGLIGMGGHMKNAFAQVHDSRVILSQHMGDLDTPRARENYRTSISDLSQLVDVSPEAVACDMHPDYYSTRIAGKCGSPLPMQHHVAHVMTAIAEHELSGSVLGFSWDGTGLGEDGTIWGGEVFAVEASTYERVATLRQFGLPGGERAVRDPRRAAAGVLYTCYGNDWTQHVPSHIRESFADGQLDTIGQMLACGINSPATSSMGRLFDAVAALLGIFVRENTYEGQAAMMLEAAAACGTERESLPLDFVGSDPLIIDWKEAILELLRRRSNGVSIEDLARSFHITLADIVVEVAMRYGISTVVLSGGCFQNSTLLELCAKRLTDCGFTARWPQRVPLNDGGLALGQVQAAMRSMRRKE